MTNFEVLLEALKENGDDFDFGEVDEIFHDDFEFKTIDGDYYKIFHEDELENFIEDEIDWEINTIKKGLEDIPFVLNNLNDDFWERVYMDIVNWLDGYRENINDYYMSYKHFIILKYN